MTHDTVVVNEFRSSVFVSQFFKLYLFGHFRLFLQEKKNLKLQITSKIMEIKIKSKKLTFEFF